MHYNIIPFYSFYCSGLCKGNNQVNAKRTRTFFVGRSFWRQPIDKPNLCCQIGARLLVSLAQGVDGSEQLRYLARQPVFQMNVTLVVLVDMTY